MNDEAEGVDEAETLKSLETLHRLQEMAADSGRWPLSAALIAASDAPWMSISGLPPEIEQQINHVMADLLLVACVRIAIETADLCAKRGVSAVMLELLTAHGDQDSHAGGSAPA